MMVFCIDGNCGQDLTRIQAPQSSLQGCSGVVQYTLIIYLEINDCVVILHLKTSLFPTNGLSKIPMELREIIRPSIRRIEIWLTVIDNNSTKNKMHSNQLHNGHLIKSCRGLWEGEQERLEIAYKTLYTHEYGLISLFWDRRHN